MQEDLNFDKFEVPVQLLNQLNECTRGFVLFAFNQDGEVQPLMSFDERNDAASMFQYIRLYIEAQDEVNKDIIKMDNFYVMDEESEGEDDESDDGISF